MEDVVLDDANALVNYTGFASVSSSENSDISPSSADYEMTLSSTSSSGASATVNF